MAAPYTNIKFSDAAMPRIASAAGYNATPYNKEGFQQFLAQNPDAKAKYEQFQQQAIGTMMAARGGVVRFVDGGMVRKYADGGDAPEGVATYQVTKDGKTGYTDVGPLPGPENDFDFRTMPIFGGADFNLPDNIQTIRDSYTDAQKEDVYNDYVAWTRANPLAPTAGGPFEFRQSLGLGAIAPDTSEKDSKYALLQGNVNPPAETTQTGPAVDLGALETSRLAGITPPLARVAAQQTPQTAAQDIAAGAGQVGTAFVAQPSQAGAVTAAQAPTATPAAQVTAAEAAGAVAQASAEAAQSAFDQQIIAAQQNESSVSQVQAAQGTANLINSPANREIQAGELVSPAANAARATAFTEQVQAATASPTDKATVQGQLSELYADFDAANPPAWAAGAMRAANATMAARGLSASSMAGQAVVQAAMETALPIAQADASVFAQFEVQNLSNRQQRAMLAAQQRAQFIGQEFDQAFQARVANSARIADIANMNFNAEQQVILENSRAANTMNLANLSNRQAVVMAEAAALSQLDMANLNNRQQAAVQNAQNFLQVDMANLNTAQQASMFNAQSRVQSILSDTAAQNAARQFNATSENQTNQFFASLGSQISQFNASQSNAMSQFNVGQTNAINQFNANLLNQREQFNAQNSLVVAQSNAQWRRQIATADTAAINRANEFNATNALGVSNTAYNNIQQFARDIMFKSIDSAENALDRETRIATAIFNANASAEQLAAKLAAAEDASIAGAIGSGVSGLLQFAGTETGGGLISDAFEFIGGLF